MVLNRVVAVTAVLIGLGATASFAEHSLSYHWPDTPATIQVVDASEGRYPVRDAINAWNASHDFHIQLVRACGRPDRCITITSEPSRYLGLTKNYVYASERHHLHSSRINLSSSRSTTSLQRLSIACHELGHALGLHHRSGGETCMVNGRRFPPRPDAHDFVELDRTSHGRG